MSDNLKYLSAYCCISKLTGAPLRGNDGEVGSDLTRLKRGVRYCNNLNMQEAYYQALTHFGVINIFKEKCAGYTHLNLSASNMSDEVNRHLRLAKQFESRQLLEEAAHYVRISEAYEILKQVEGFAKKKLDSLPTNRAGNVEWKNLTCVQFYKYDNVTNSFVEITEKGNP